MKIYIENYNINELAKKQNNLEKYYLYSKSKNEFYSSEGIFYIEDNDILLYKMDVVKDISFRSVIKSESSVKYNLIVDGSIVERKLEYQIPFDSIYLRNEKKYYSINNKSKVKLVIERIYNDVDIDSNTHFNEKHNSFYFEIECKENIEDPIIKEELNVFLSLLN